MIRTAYSTQAFWRGFISLLMAVISSLTQASLASTGQTYADDPTVFADPQPLVVKRLDELVRQLGDKAEEIRKDPNMAYRISDELMAPHIDFPRIARLIIGKYWRDASESQRRQLVKEIEELLTRSYVTAMVSYVDQIVAQQKDTRYHPSRYKPGDRKTSVRATIPLEGGQTADVQYQLYYKDEWKIYDIRIEGISLAITYRSSMGERIRKVGIDGLIAELAERNRKGEVELPESIAPEEPVGNARINIIQPAAAK
ncbi:MAG: phospholipid-binding protein MlaC [Thiogranum sp.]